MWPFEFHLDRDAVCDGDWWLPSNQSIGSHGKLNYSAITGISLELTSPLLKYPNFEPPTPVTLHGEIGQQTPITVFDALSGYSRIGGNRIQQVTASAFVAGDHLESLDSTVDGMTLDVDDLNEWISPGPFSFNHLPTQAGASGAIQIHYEIEDEADVVIDVDSLGGEISFDFSLTENGGGHSISFEQNYSANIRFHKSRSLRAAIAVAHDFELLMTLLIGSRSVVKYFNLGKRTGFVGKDRCLVYHRIRSQKRRRLFHRDQMPANYQLIGPQLGQVFDSWFSLCDKYRPVLGLLSASILQPDMSNAESGFLAMMQAIEAYCRIRSRETYLTAEEFAEVTARMSKCIPDGTETKVRNSLRGKLGFLNEFSLKDRLRSLVDKNKWLESTLRYSDDPARHAEDTKKFIKDVVDARNSLTHVDTRRHSSIPVGAVWRLRMMLCLSLLSEAGVDIGQRVSGLGEYIPFWWMEIPEL